MPYNTSLRLLANYEPEVPLLEMVPPGEKLGYRYIISCLGNKKVYIENLKNPSSKKGMTYIDDYPKYYHNNLTI